MPESAAPAENEQPTAKPLLTPGEVAARLRQSERTIREWAANGTLPGIKIGREWRFDPDKIDEKLSGAAV